HMYHHSALPHPCLVLPPNVSFYHIRASRPARAEHFCLFHLRRSRRWKKQHIFRGALTLPRRPLRSEKEYVYDYGLRGRVPPAGLLLNEDHGEVVHRVLAGLGITDAHLVIPAIHDDGFVWWAVEVAVDRHVGGLVVGVVV